MTRPYPPHAYSDAPRARCYWPTTVTPPVWPRLEGDLCVDVAVIGGGFTGLSAALELARAGVRVAVVEARQPGWGASGRNGGFCCLGGAKASAAQITRQFGSAAAADWAMTERAAVAWVDALITRHGLAVDRHSKGETVLAHSPAAWSRLQVEAESVQNDYGVPPQLIPASDLAAQGLGNAQARSAFYGAMTVPLGFGLNPLKYLSGLAVAAHESGALCFGDTAVLTTEQTANGWRLDTGTGHIMADKLVVATNGYSSDHLPDWLRARFMPAQSAVLVTEVIPDAVAQAQGWTSDQMAFTARDFLHYFRRMPCGRMLFGMRGSLLSSPRADIRAEARLRAAFADMFPHFARAPAPHVWSGLVSLSADLTPFCGPVPGAVGLYAALNFHGNGVAMGSYAGAVLSDLVLKGKTERRYPTVLSRPVPRFPGGRMRRHLLWPAYGWRMLRDF